MNLIPAERALAKECSALRKQYILPAMKATAEGYWRIGSLFVKYEQEGKIVRIRGGETVKNVSQELNMAPANLYSAISFARQYPTWETAETMIQGRIRQQLSTDWYAIRTDVLPAHTEHTPEERHDAVMTRIERKAHHLEKEIDELKAAREEVNADVESIETVIGAVEEVIEEARHIRIEKPTRQADVDYIKWLKSQPEFVCIITGDIEADACHLQSVGAGGADYFVFPLTRELHSESHSNPSFFYRNKIQIAKWFYRLPVIHYRYCQETGMNYSDIQV